MSGRRNRGNNNLAVEILGNNIRFLACAISALTVAYCTIVACVLSGVLVPVPRILTEIMPFSYLSIVSWTTRYAIIGCDFTFCAIILGIFATLTNHRDIFYVFFVFLGAIVVLEISIMFFFVYNPMQKLSPKLTQYMISLMNQNVKLMERKGIDNIATLQEVDNQKLAKLQRELTCCGVESIRDWEIRIQDRFKERLRNQTIPISCCWHPYQKAKYFCTATEAYKDTCLAKVLFYLSRFVSRTGRLMSVVISLQLILMGFYWNKVYRIFIVPSNT